MLSESISNLYPTFSALLVAIQKRPTLFLNSKSARALSTFINGIHFAETFHNIEPSKQFCDFDFDIFEEWVDDSFNPHSLTLNSFGLAEYLSNSDSESLDLWFNWYETFSKTKMIH